MKIVKINNVPVKEIPLKNIKLVGGKVIIDGKVIIKK